ncbi:aminotransferase class I/II-fold pyridoxal phosphate-dependent enzyme [Brachyspira hyodysenteriae]|nr:aminotransferase class I/II-fold pyridoxal phosphate-dependent enzyme [Brachyspira hyodysenteriae]MDA0073217.1 aminotransferase class I/II-fold pyridoxal phosphate-dependent enzyme [Brachyspira hyodysenteriae]
MRNLIQGLKNIKYSFNSYTINRLSIIAGIEAIKDNQYFKDTVNKVINTREKTKIKLKELGFNVLDSKSNFIFISHKNIFAEDIYLKLKDKGILVRYFKSDLINNYIRVTIGTDEEMDIFVEKIKYIIKN